MFREGFMHYNDLHTVQSLYTSDYASTVYGGKSKKSTKSPSVTISPNKRKESSNSRSLSPSRTGASPSQLFRSKISSVLSPNKIRSPAILYQDSFCIDKLNKLQLINDDSNPTSGYTSPKLIPEKEKLNVFKR
jgi:hypothetical protein